MLTFSSFRFKLQQKERYRFLFLSLRNAHFLKNFVTDMDSAWSLWKSSGLLSLYGHAVFVFFVVPAWYLKGGDRKASTEKFMPACFFSPPCLLVLSAKHAMTAKAVPSRHPAKIRQKSGRKPSPKGAVMWLKVSVCEFQKENGKCEGFSSSTTHISTEVCKNFDRRIIHHFQSKLP